MAPAGESRVTSAPIGARALAQLAKGVLGHAVRRFLPARVDLPLQTFGLSRDAGGRLALRGVALEPLLRRFGSPLFVADARKLDDNLGAFVQENVICAYSYKTNPVPAVLERLHARGAWAEVISEYETWLARELGVPGERIVSNGPGRSPEAFAAAIEVGALVNLNHREEIAMVAAMARARGKRARVGLRVVTAGGWGGQFGEPIDAAMDVYREMRQRPELEVVAVHSHLGTGVHDEGDVARLAREVVAFAARLRSELGLAPTILDFGGSLGSPTVARYDALALRLNRALSAELLAPPAGLSIEAYVRALVSSVEGACRDAQIPVPRIIVEPGRALTSNTQLLLCRVTSLKASGARGVVHAILDAGVNVAEPVRNEFHQIYVDGAPRGPERAYRLVGPICTPMDTLVWSMRLPELAPGDVIAIADAGAYFVPFSTSFSFPQPGVALVEDGTARLVRRKETFDDLVRRDRPLASPRRATDAPNHDNAS
ncbi:MAG TPA: alanine racemase [Polyangiaceae bacterium]|jgi:diaminopimelate decarboxylase